ncbi:glycosyltransferase [Chromobacterium sp. ATCC 53434]|uniref:glycosyltransferase n=1 Tax=Chromobacterium sp. (strain ATCC 53434 / SC 14030) TaxID=2059672 RepID=UPI001305133C|nr:glycosyltransferase [Chromobacterium sp. ATCC 53434]
MEMVDRQEATGEDDPLWVLACSGTGGDILPFIAVGRQLAARGHRVRLLTPAPYVDWVASHGLACDGFGSEQAFLACLDNPDLWDERKGFAVVWQSVAPYLQVLRELAARESGRCHLICHPIMLAAANLAKAARPGIKVAALHLAPSGLCSSHEFPALGSLVLPAWLPLAWKRRLWRWVYRFWLDPIMLPALNAARRDMALPPLDSFDSLLRGTPDAVLGLFPSWFAATQPDWPAPYFEAGFPPVPTGPAAELSAELQAFLDAGPAPVAFTPGTGHKHAGRYFESALAALARCGRRGLLITPHREQVPESLPPDVLWLPHAPFELLLPRLAALAHHGGIGTCAAAFRAGVPQLICPYAFDQFDNGWRARRLGVAETVPAGKLTAGTMAAALRRLLASEPVAESCARTAGLAGAGSAFAAAERLEQALGLRVSRPLPA